MLGIRADCRVETFAGAEMSALDQVGSLLTRSLTATNLDLSGYAELVLVHNVGTASVSQLEDTPEQEIIASINTNVTSMLLLNRAFVHLLKSHAAPLRGRVINISSLAGVRAFEWMTLYCTAKAAREMALQVMAKVRTHSACIGGR